MLDTTLLEWHSRLVKGDAKQIPTLCWRIEPLEQHADMVITTHPEGVLCATGANTPVLLWDLHTPDTIARLAAGLGATRETNGYSRSNSP